jgi:NADPH-dependent 2,4-dienoyl-CoA reductase/sulfur reductase-like enzyme
MPARHAHQVAAGAPDPEALYARRGSDTMTRIVVVGGSLAGHGAAKALRDLGYDGQLTVVGSEPHRPYDRYPLSKAFLTGDLHRHGLDIGGAPADTTWRLGETATGLDLTGRHVVVDDRCQIPFDGLVVATGARPRDAESVAGVRGAFALRTVDDAGGLRAALDSRARRVVVVGGGLIGAEVAATAAASGHDTTLVDPSDVPTRRTVGLPIAEYLLGLHLAAGVHVRPRTRTRRLDIRDGAVAGVVLDDGTRLSADVVVMATGTAPNVEWLRGSGLSVSAGLACRPTLHAVGDDRVVGAGDVVNVPHPLLDGESLRVEHWASTLDQAALAAANLVAGPDAARPLTTLPTFGTTIHEARIRSIGFPQVADRSRVVWGSVESGQALVAMGRGDRLVALVSLNAHERLGQLADGLRPGSAFDDLQTAG